MKIVLKFNYQLVGCLSQSLLLFKRFLSTLGLPLVLRQKLNIVGFGLIFHYCFNFDLAHAQCVPPAGFVASTPNTVYYAGGSCSFYDSDCALLLEVPASEAIWSCSPANAKWVLVTPLSGGYYEFPNYSNTSPQVDTDHYMKPFWTCDTVMNELVLLDGLGSEAKLMYQPIQIISVQNHDYSKEFIAGIDYSVEGRVITQLSAAASEQFATLFGNGLNTIQPSSWTNVTYIPNRIDWAADSLFVTKGELLPKFKGKLAASTPITIQALGMSITAGHHVSGFAGDPNHFSPGIPFMRGYVDMFGEKISQHYGVDVSIFNSSCGGKTAAWANEYGEAMVNLNAPDLILIDMGMNDIWGTPIDSFQSSISACIEKLSTANPDAEFILIANMLPDVNAIGAPSNGVEQMIGFRNKLLALEAIGVACLDMTAISDTIYRRKGAKSCTSNALHPNDYLSRWYAQALFHLLDNTPPQSHVGSTYYVSTTGSNGDGRSLSNAWTSLERVNATQLFPGDTVLFEGGSVFYGGIELDHLDGNGYEKPVVFSSFGTNKAIIQTLDSSKEGFVARNTGGILLENLEFRGPNQLNQSGRDGILFFTNKNFGYFSDIELKNVEVSGFGYCGIRFYSDYLPAVKAGFKDVKIEQCTVHTCRENGIVSIGYDNQNSTNYQHNNFSIKDTRVFNITGYGSASHKGSGIVLSQVDSALIDHCEVFNTGMGNTACGGPGGIWAYSANRVIIQYCESHHNSAGLSGGCDGFGFDLDGGVSNSIIQYCYSHDNDGPGILLGNFWASRPWLNNTVRYNISINDSRTNNSSVTLFTAPGTIWDGLRFYNNTIVAYKSNTNSTPSAGAFQITDFGTSMSNIICFNNIFQTNGGLPLLDVPTTFVQNSPNFIGNLYWSSGYPFSVYYGQQVSSLAEFRMLGEGCENRFGVETGINLDPQFLGNVLDPIVWYPGQNSDFELAKLENASPAIDSGIDHFTIYNSSIALKDFWGTGVPVNNKPDIGAFEFLGNVGNTEKNLHFSPDIIISPNPSGGLFEVTLPFDPDRQDRYNIYTQNGIPVLRATVGPYQTNPLRCSLGSLTTGYYIFEYASEQGTYRCNFIINRF